MKVLAYWENGFRCLTNSVEPVTSPEDMVGLKLRTPENPIILATMKALGANPSPLPWPEVYMALQQKAFDGQENPIPIIYVHKIYEVQKYLSITNHVYEPMPVVINKDFWDSLTTEQQEIIENAALESQSYNRQMIKEQTDDMLVKLEQEGMVISYPDLKPFQEATKNVREQFVDQFGAQLIKDAYNFDI
jgi:tripartite ATP-independent transporter DctP family solute receptor